MAQAKNLLMIVVDCLGSDALLGRGKSAVTPRIDELCERGVSFPNAITAATYTTASFASLLTGLYPSAHGIRSQSGDHKLSPRAVSLATVLRENGYDTAAFVTGPLGKEIGLNRGFRRFEYRSEKEAAFGEWGRKFLKAFPSRFQAPWFVFLHLWEMHTPRGVVPSCDSEEYGRTPYDRALSSIDPFVGELIRRADPSETVAVLTGDHGEEVRQERSAGLKSLIRSVYHRFKLFKQVLQEIDRRSGLRKKMRGLGMAFHGYHVYDMLARVPLVIVPPRGIEKPGCEKVISNQVRTIDVSPTVLDLLGISASEARPCQGRSLAPLFSGEEIDLPPAIIEAIKQAGRLLTHLLIGIRTPEWKLAFAEDDPAVAWEMYNLADDPEERRNLAKESPEIAKDLHRQALEILRESERLREPGEVLSSEEKASVERRLKALGYL